MITITPKEHPCYSRARGKATGGGRGRGTSHWVWLGTRTGEKKGVGIREAAGARGSPKGQDGAGQTRVGAGGEVVAVLAVGRGAVPGGRAAGVAARGALTAAERGLAVPDVPAGGFPAGLPQGQVVLVVGRDPSRAQHGTQVQTQRQEDAHQPDQLQRGQHRHAHLLPASARRSHARGAAVRRPAGGEDARRVPRAGSPTSLEGKQPRRRTRGSLPRGSAPPAAAKLVCGGGPPGRGRR